jgi:hypothetical protein
MTLFVTMSGAAWVWAPAAAVLWEQLSPAAPIVAGLTSFLLIHGVRNSRLAPFQESLYVGRTGDGLFAGALRRTPARPQGYAIALLAYSGCAAIVLRAN